MTLVLRWAWRYGGLDVHEHDSLDTALLAAFRAAEYNEEALECIETWDAGTHECIPAEEALRLADRRHSQIFTASPPLPVVANVEVRAPNGRWARESFHDMAEAEEYANRLRLVMGPERVTLRVMQVR
jgi:hypothetical protein